MARLEAPGAGKASLSRRVLLAAGSSALLAACGEQPNITVSRTPPLAGEQLVTDIEAIARAARPGLLGVSLMNLENSEVFLQEGERPFPMQSVFKAPLGAAVLGEVDAGRLSLDESFLLEAGHLSPPFSPIAAAWPTRRDYTARQLLEAAVGRSDNTAADVLLKRIGGPGAVTAWLDGRRLDEVRIDRYERELQPQIYGMASFRPDWRTDAAFLRARDSVPPQTRLAAIRRYLTDPRDTATPRGILDFLGMLHRGELLTARSTQLLLGIMTHTATGPNRLRAGLPMDALLAHKTGTAGTDLGINPATADIGIFTLADRRAYAIAVFLAGSTADEATRDRIIADVARTAVRAVA